MELYSFFPKGAYFHFYPFSLHKDETIRWYVTALCDRSAWIITTAVVWYYLRKKAPQIASYWFIFVLYRILDMVAYICTGGIAGIFYLVVYIPIIIYGTYIAQRQTIWTCAEWLYSKIKKKNGNGSNR